MRSSKDSDGDWTAGLPTPSARDREALWLARAPRRLGPVELAAWLAATCDKSDEARLRHVFEGEPFVL